MEPKNNSTAQATQSNTTQNLYQQPIAPQPTAQQKPPIASPPIQQSPSLPPQPPTQQVPPMPPQPPVGPPPESKNGFPKIIILVAILLILSVSGVAGYFVFDLNPMPEAEEVACTAEAMICPDGSSVGRSGPNCEFAPCPSSITEDEDPIPITDDWLIYEGDGFRFEHPNDWNDSNCTANMNHIATICSPNIVIPNMRQALYYSLNVSKRTIPTDKNFDEYKIEHLRLSEELEELFWYEEIEIGSYSGYKTELIPKLNGNEVIYLKNPKRNEEYVMLHYSPYDPNLNYPGQDSHYGIYQQILSTFRFTQ